MLKEELMQDLKDAMKEKNTIKIIPKDIKK